MKIRPESSLRSTRSEDGWTDGHIFLFASRDHSGTHYGIEYSHSIQQQSNICNDFFAIGSTTGRSSIA